MFRSTVLIASVTALILTGCTQTGTIRRVEYSTETGAEASVYRGQEQVELVGETVEAEDEAPDVKLTDQNWDDYPISSWEGKILVISVAPSLDTPVCENQTLRFEELAKERPDVAFISVSRDLPSALARFDSEHELDHIALMSDYHYESFGQKYGLEMKDNSLLARGALVIDRDGVIRHVQVMKLLQDEPVYSKVMDAVRKYR